MTSICCVGKETLAIAAGAKIHLVKDENSSVLASCNVPDLVLISTICLAETVHCTLPVKFLTSDGQMIWCGLEGSNLLAQIRIGDNFAVKAICLEWNPTRDMITVQLNNAPVQFKGAAERPKTFHPSVKSHSLSRKPDLASCLERDERENSSSDDAVSVGAVSLRPKCSTFPRSQQPPGESFPSVFEDIPKSSVSDTPRLELSPPSPTLPAHGPNTSWESLASQSPGPQPPASPPPPLPKKLSKSRESLTSQRDSSPGTHSPASSPPPLPRKLSKSRESLASQRDSSPGTHPPASLPPPVPSRLNRSRENLVCQTDSTLGPQPPASVPPPIPSKLSRSMESLINQSDSRPEHQFSASHPPPVPSRLTRSKENLAGQRDSSCGHEHSSSPPPPVPSRLTRSKENLASQRDSGHQPSSSPPPPVPSPVLSPRNISRSRENLASQNDSECLSLDPPASSPPPIPSRSGSQPASPVVVSSLVVSQDVLVVGTDVGAILLLPIAGGDVLATGAVQCPALRHPERQTERRERSLSSVSSMRQDHQSCALKGSIASLLLADKRVVSLHTPPTEVAMRTRLNTTRSRKETRSRRQGSILSHTIGEEEDGIRQDDHSDVGGCDLSLDPVQTNDSQTADLLVWDAVSAQRLDTIRSYWKALHVASE